MKLSATELGEIAGVVLSLLFFYTPRLKDWYESQDGQTKSLIMLAAVVLTASGVFGLSCAEIVLAVTCDKAGAVGLVKLVVAVAISNQSTFLIVRKLTANGRQDVAARCCK